MKRLAVSALALALLGGCAHALTQTRIDAGQTVPRMLDRPHLKDYREPSVEPGSKVVAYELAWQRRDPDAVARRLAGAVEVLLGQEAAGKLSRETTNAALRSVTAGREAGSWVRLESTPILAKYDAAHDEIRVIHEERDTVKSLGRDIGIDGAREVAETYLARLSEAKVIDPRLYEQAAMQLGYAMMGEGPVEKAVQPGRITGYRITYRPRLQGFELVNAGLRLGIAASGEVASLRLGGVTPMGEWQQDGLKPTGKGGEREVRVGTQELMARFHRQVPKDAQPEIAWSRVMYVLPEGESQAVVAPMLLVSYTEVRKTESGPVASRRKTLAYSLTDPQAAPIDFDAPAPRHEGIEPTRKY